MNLILLRHCEAEDSGEDFSRKLTQKGKKDAKKVAKFLLKNLKGDFKVYSSPLIRAKETASYLLKDVEILDELNPSSTPNSFLKEISKKKFDTIVAVGHQPLIGAIAGNLLGLNLSLNVKKGGFFWFKGENVKEMELYCFLPPSLI
jgi:phosphohistidine phosphatase